MILAGLHKLALILIAAGSSKRFGAQDKLSADYRGQQMIGHALQTYAVLPLSERILVLRPHSDFDRLPQAAEYKAIFNPNADDGMGASISAGMVALGDCDGVMVALADMPAIQPDTVTSLIEAAKHTDKTIILPDRAGKDGHPVIFAKQHFGHLRQLDADIGGRDIIKANPHALLRVPVEDDGVRFDIDRPEDLRG